MSGSVGGLPQVGFIGAGLMGHGIIKNILKGGYGVTFLDHPGNRPCDDLTAAGATTAPDIKGVVAAADVVCVCVTGSPEVEAVVLSDGGVASALKEGTLMIDLSTAMPDRTVQVADAVIKGGGRYMDAAMTRTPKEAEEGRLNLLVGAADADLAEARPLLDCFAENIFHAGPVSAGHRLKLIHNFLSLGKAALVAEAVNCAHAGGVDMDVFMDVMDSGGGGSTALNRMKPYVKDGDASALTFAIGNAAKDLGYYVAMAAESGVAHDGALALARVFEQARDGNFGDQPVPKLLDFLKHA